MIYLVAILLPWLALMIQGKVGQGILCLLLQLTLIGWIPAVIWAILVINNDESRKRHEQMMMSMMNNQVYNKPKEYLDVEEKARLYYEMMKAKGNK